MVNVRAATAGLTLHEERDGGTRWQFSPVRTVQTRCGTGLCAARAFAKGEVVLADRWLVGVLLEADRSRKNACEHCLRLCAWSPVDHSCPGCGARYCSADCRDSAWNLHHRLLCTAVSPTVAAPATQPLDVFRKHARLAPAVLEQKHEEVLLAAQMLAACTLWDDDASAAAATGAAAEAGGANVMRVARLASAAARLALRHESASRTFAEWAHSERRRLTRVYKHATPQPLRHYIFVINLSRYKDPVGLDWDSACIKYNNDWPRIIRAAGRPNAGVDTLLVGFRSWLLLQRRSYVQAAWRATRKWKARAGEVLREKPLAQGPRGVVVV